jgi:hypothetical protein
LAVQVTEVPAQQCATSPHHNTEPPHATRATAPQGHWLASQNSLDCRRVTGASRVTTRAPERTAWRQGLAGSPTARDCPAVSTPGYHHAPHNHVKHRGVNWKTAGGGAALEEPVADTRVPTASLRHCRVPRLSSAHGRGRPQGHHRTQYVSTQHRSASTVRRARPSATAALPLSRSGDSTAASVRAITELVSAAQSSPPVPARTLVRRPSPQ